MQEFFPAIVSLLISLLVAFEVIPASQEKLFLEVAQTLQESQTAEGAVSPSAVVAVPPSDLPQVLVTKVVDGDTIKLENGQTVRYIGIDTPETKHPTKADGCFGAEASAKNTELVLGKMVTLQKDVSEVDRYDRQLRYVWVGDQLVNEVLVREGYAVARSYPPDVALQEQLVQAENSARENNRGLWGDECK